ncbi:MAG TPA: hypothetical protein VFI17_03560 [Solirubrobacterales bacterium]|nr:hypothetical protein [Solirubrobacterales bacterium]
MDGDRLAGQPPAEPAAADGILISLQRDGDQVQLDVTSLGDVRVTELPALLGLARKLSEDRLGIGRG